MIALEVLPLADRVVGIHVASIDKGIGRGHGRRGVVDQVVRGGTAKEALHSNHDQVVGVQGFGVAGHFIDPVLQVSTETI